MIDLRKISTTDLLDELVSCIDLDPDNCPPDIIDAVVERISDEYLQTPERILAEKAIEAQREQLIEFMRREDTKILVAFSGGKDSVVMALYLMDLGIPPERIELHHQEVDGKGEQLFDWATTTQYCQAFADHFGFPIYFSYREGGIVREALKGVAGHPNISGDYFFQTEPGGEFQRHKFGGQPKARGMWPSVAMDLSVRWCSAFVKIDVMGTMLRNTKRLQNKDIVVCTGERHLESELRETYTEINPYGQKLIKKRKTISWRPILTWSHQEVWDYMKKHNVQPHPAYMLGWGRCSCQTCIYGQKDAWASIMDLNPEKIARIAELEIQMNFTMYDNKTIYDKLENGSSWVTDKSDYWKKQATENFDAPIVVENWTMPPGANNMENCGAD